MVDVSLSPLGGAGWQFLDNSGNILANGRLYTFQAGSSTPAPTYSDSTGNTSNGVYVQLDSAGRPPEEIWQDSSQTLKFVLRKYVSTGVYTDIRTYDGIPPNATVAQLSALEAVVDAMTPLVDLLQDHDFGTLPAGASGGLEMDYTITGNALGTSVFYGLTRRVSAMGTNNYATVRNSYFGTDIETTAGVVNVAEGTHTYVWMHNNGDVNYVRGVSSHIRLDGNGNVLQNAYCFNAVDLTLGGGTGIINQITGFDCGQIGHATRVTNAVGFSVGALVASGTVIGLSSSIAAGTSKWNLYLDGTADNLIEGNIRFGATSRAATGTGGITWATNVAPGSTGIQIQEWAKVLGAGGALRYIPLLS